MSPYPNLSASISIPNHQLIEVGGQDALDFLHKLTSQDLLPLKDEDGMRYTLLLNPQGRFLFDFFVTRQSGILYIDAAASQVETLLQLLNRYKLRADVIFKSVAGQQLFLENAGVDSAKDPRHPDLGYRRWDTGAAVEDGNYNTYRISLGIVEPSEDMQAGSDMPLDFGLDNLNAISFSKGCYPGQEITTRMHNRDKAKYRIEVRPIAEAVDTKIVASNGDKAIVQIKRD